MNLMNRMNLMNLRYSLQLPPRETAGIGWRVHVEIERRRVVQDLLRQRRVDGDIAEREVARAAGQCDRVGRRQTGADDDRSVHASRRGMNVGALNRGARGI